MQKAARVESGIVQFDDDWPGVFIRGDDAFGYLMAFKSVVVAGDAMSKHMIKSLELLLESSNIDKHKPEDVQRLSVKAGYK